MSVVRFPQITEKNKLWLALLVGTFAMTSYKIAGEVTMHLDPRMLPFSALDRAVPLLPWTFWIYLSVYGIYISSCLLQKDLQVFGRFLLSYLIGYGLSTIFFVLYPTTFPRELFPLDGVDGASAAGLAWFRALDRPTNCLPSMHVASCVMVTLPFRGKRPVLFGLFSFWTLAISVATLTTKQHYLVDVVTGALFGLACYAAASYLHTSGKVLGLGASKSTPPVV